MDILKYKTVLINYFNKIIDFIKHINIKNIFNRIDNTILKFAESFNVIENKLSKKDKKNEQR